MKKAFTTLLIGLLLASPALRCQTDELTALRKENIRLRSMVDSLEYVTRHGHGRPRIVNTWDNLTKGGPSDNSDSVYKTRVEKMNGELRIRYNDVLREYLDFYNKEKAEQMRSIAKRFNASLPLFLEEFRRAGIPDELTALAIVESAVDPDAVSRSGAAGMWQLMPETAREFGLDYLDRFDVGKSTRAAAQQLARSHRLLGDWRLAVAAYNCGDGTVQKAISKAGGRRDYWSVHPFLPEETQGYLPSLISVIYYLKYNY